MNNFERGQDPRAALGIGITTDFHKFATVAGMRRAEPDEEDLDMSESHEFIAKWQQYDRGKWWAGYLILFRDRETKELKTFINSDYDEDEYPLDMWMAQPIWIYHFRGD